MEARKVSMLRRAIKRSKGRANAPPGRVKVFVRIRPCGVNDVRGEQGKGAVTVGDADMTKVNVVEGKTERVFEFDQIIPQSSSNDEVYRVVGKPLVEACLTGLNGILMAYGQTGAGKTYSLMSSNGITSKVINTIFSIVERDQIHSYSISFSYLQIYQERVYDLLSAGNTREVFLREHPKKGIYVERLSEMNVKGPEQVSTLLSTGRKRLAFAETKMNRQSSRSHAVCQIKVERFNLPSRFGVFEESCTSESDFTPCISGISTPLKHGVKWRSGESIAQSSESSTSYFDYEEDDDVFSKVTALTQGASTVRGRLYICDLAGSERIKKTKAQGERLHEAQCINSSLLELGNVIHALAEGKRKHIPFRNSVLTRFLQDGLSGNSKTSLIVCVSPSLSDVNETLCSLKFGLRAMKVECTAQVNIEIDYEKMARQLAETLETKEREWRRQLSDYDSYIASLQRDVTDPGTSQLGLPNPSTHPVMGPWQKTISGPVEEGLKNQTKALLLAELISMELYYGMEDLIRDGGTAGACAGLGQEVSPDKLYELTDRDLLLHSAETLLELTEYFFTKSTFCTGDNSSGKNSSNALPPPLTTVFPDPSYTGKLLRVRGTLGRIKEMTDGASVKFLANLLENDSSETGKGLDSHKRQLHEKLKEFVKRAVSLEDTQKNALDLAEVLNLEQTLCHVLMDKALLNCILLLDKAEMERRIKQMKDEQSRFDFSAVDPVLMKYRKKSSEDGRLVSVDEGVVLEGSESTNSREKLSTPLESSSLAEMEAENRTLCESNARMRRKLEDSERNNECLTQNLQELQEKLSNVETSLSDLMESNTHTQTELQGKLNDSEFERDELSLLVKQQEEKLRESELKFSLLSEAEREVRLEVSGELHKELDKAKVENNRLCEQVQELKKKLAVSQGDILVSRAKTKLENALCDEIPTKETHLDNVDSYEKRIKSLLAENSRLLDDSAKLKARIRELENDISKVKEEETRIREDLCEKLATKLTAAQNHSEGLGHKVIELENQLRHAETSMARQKELDSKEKENVFKEMKVLKAKLTAADDRNRSFCANVNAVEDKLDEVAKVLASKKEKETAFQRRIKELEKENLELRQSSQRELVSASMVSEELSARGESQDIFGENAKHKDVIVGLEAQILVKDQEILCLKNEIVDLMSEVSKLDGESNELSADKVRLDKEVKELRATRDEAEAELQHILKECVQLKNDGATYLDENKTLREKMESHSKIIKDSVNAVLAERAALESNLTKVQQRAKNLEGDLSNSESLNKTLEIDIEKQETTICALQLELDSLLSEKSKLEFSIGDLTDKNVNSAEENDALQHDLSRLEKNLSTLQDSLKFCLREKTELAQEMSVKSAEVETLRTYASLCFEEVRSMKSQIDLYKETEDMLQCRVEELEQSMTSVTNESLHLKEDLTSIEDERKGLEKRIQEASRAIDRVKMELLTLMQTVLALQKELLCIVDSILISLGLDCRQLHGAKFRFVSIDSGYTSTNTETCSERSSESSDGNIANVANTCYVVPDEECLVNPSEISVIRENKSEIFRMHEELKIKLLIIKEHVDRLKVVSPMNTNSKVEGTIMPQSRDTTEALQPESSKELSEAISAQVKDFPYLNKAERDKLTDLLSVLRSEDSLNDGIQVYDIYARLEGKLSGLSSQLASKEMEICKLLKEKILLHDQLTQSKYGISLCEHCLNDPKKLEESNELLRTNLISYMEDTARLEADIMDFAEYKAKLEKELNSVREQITELEDELSAGVHVHGNVPLVTITPDSEFTEDKDKRERKGSDSSATASTISCTESYADLKTKKSRPQKHVTFEQMDGALAEKDSNFNLDKHKLDDKLPCAAEQALSEVAQSGDKSLREHSWDGSDIDLCALLESIPLEAPKKPATPEQLELEERVNRLSEYENVGYKDKVEMIFERRTCEGTSEQCPNDRRSDIDRRSDPSARDSMDESNCRMCGLLRKNLASGKRIPTGKKINKEDRPVQKKW